MFSRTSFFAYFLSSGCLTPIILSHPGIKDDVNTKYDYLFSLTNLFGKITGTGTSVTLNDTSNTIMKLNLDTTTSSQEETPSPSDPQEIHVIKGNNDIKISNKNLLKITTFSDDTTTKTVNGITATIKDGKIHISGTSSARTTFTLKKNDFTVSNEFYYYCNSINSVTRLEMQCKVDGATKYLNSYSTANFQNATTSFEYTSLYVVVENGQTVNHTFTPMIVEGNTVSQYEPYKKQTYSVNLGDIELCKIGDYKDVLFKNTMDSDYYDSSLELNKWYKLANVGKITYDGTEYWDTDVSGGYNRFSAPAPGIVRLTGRNADCISNYFRPSVGNEYGIIFHVDRVVYLYPESGITTVSQFKTWLSTHNTTVYYPLATPTYTLLNDTLQTQLDNLQYALAYDTQTNISQTNTDLPFIIDAETYQDISGKLDTSKVKNANSTTAGDVYDVRYINNMIGDVETILTRLTTGSGV